MPSGFMLFGAGAFAQEIFLVCRQDNSANALAPTNNEIRKNSDFYPALLAISYEQLAISKAQCL